MYDSLTVSSRLKIGEAPLKEMSWHIKVISFEDQLGNCAFYNNELGCLQWKRELKEREIAFLGNPNV